MKQYGEYMQLFNSVLDYECDILKAGHSNDILPGESDEKFHARQERHLEYIKQADLLSTLRIKYNIW
jgi:hypothetical protein